MGKQCSSNGLWGMRASGYSSRSSLYRGLFENGGKSPEQGAECELQPCESLLRKPLFGLDDIAQGLGCGPALLDELDEAAVDFVGHSRRVEMFELRIRA